jgi:hypothetical protein
VPDEKKFDPFKPAQPVVPGVPTKRPARPEPPKQQAAAEPEPPAEPVQGQMYEPATAKPTPLDRLKQLPPKTLAAAGGGLVLLVILVVWAMSPSEPEAVPEAGSAVASPEASGAETPPAEPPVRPVTLPGEIATIEELAEPWSSKKFVIRRVTTNERVAAMVIRLPGTSGRSAESYWAFLVRPPFGRCDLEYITDVERIQQEYGYAARHAMVVDPCNATVYDPARYGNLGGAYARGEVVSGSAFRPPLGVELKVEGNLIIALRTE